MLELPPISLPRVIEVAAVSPVFAELQTQLAEKDEQIAELKERIRLLEGSDTWEDVDPFCPPTPDDSWLN